MFSWLQRSTSPPRDCDRDQLSDLTNRSATLLQSPEESVRISALRSLARSADMGAIDLVLSTRKNDPSVLVRSVAEATLVAISNRHPEEKAEIALKFMQLVVNDSDIEPSSSSSALQHSLKTFNRILKNAVFNDKQIDRLISLLENWWEQRQMTQESVLEIFVKNAIHGDQKAIVNMGVAAEKIAESNCDLAIALTGVPGHEADMKRLQLLEDLTPGPGAQLLFETIAPHAESAPIKARLMEIQSAWNTRYIDNVIYTADLNALSECLNGRSTNRLRLYK